MEENNVKNKHLKIILVPILIALMIIIIAVIVAYVSIKEAVSYPTEEIKQNCNIETYEYCNRKVFEITPKDGVKNEKVILYFHGGSYFAEMTVEHWNFIQKLIDDTGSKIILPDYPLAPKSNVVDVFGMVEPLYQKIISQTNPENLIIMGDSAGGGLSLALEEKLAKDNILEPSKTILISPWLDVTMENPEIKDVQKNDTDLSTETLKVAGITYAGEKDTKNYLVSPLYGDISKLKNITIFTGTYDILNPDVHILQKKAQEIGNEITIKEFEKAKHIWIIKNNCDEELVNKAYNELILKIKN